MKYPQLRVSPSTKERLESLGTMNDSFNGVIERLLDHYENCPHQGTTTTNGKPSEASTTRR